MTAKARPIPDKRYFKIGEVCALAELKPHVLRYWESEFKELKPAKGKSSHRLYRRQDVEAVLQIKELLYQKRFTIAGAKQALKEASRQASPDEDSDSQQLRLDFDSSDYKSILRSVLEELKSLRAELDQRAEKK